MMLHFENTVTLAALSDAAEDFHIHSDVALNPEVLSSIQGILTNLVKHNYNLVFNQLDNNLSVINDALEIKVTKPNEHFHDFANLMTSLYPCQIKRAVPCVSVSLPNLLTAFQSFKNPPSLGSVLPQELQQKIGQLLLPPNGTSASSSKPT